MRGYVGVTDGHWARFLRTINASEVNFWLPNPDTGFAALKPGEPFMFKTHYPDNRIVGGGFFEHFARLRISEAWDFMGEGNGCPDLATMVHLVSRYRRGTSDPDPYIGCVFLNEVTFFDDANCQPGPSSMAKNIVRGKGYPLDGSESEIERVVAMLLAGHSIPSLGPTRGAPRLVTQRLGQGGFKAVMLDVYEQRCAITGHKIRPTLEAAHIKSVAAGGEHRVDNGLLLRADVHKMFDTGYITVDPGLRLRVSPRLHTEFGNGDEFYAREGETIRVPRRTDFRPNREFLEWHADEVFKAS